MSVRVVKVGSIAEQIRGVTYSKEDASDRPAEGMIPILRANNITEDGLVFDGLVYVPDRCVNPRQRIMKGDIVIAASSGSIDVVGKAAPALSYVNAAFGAFCKVVRPGSEVCPDYLAHYFRTANYRRIISSLAAGANINNLRSEHINELQLPLPKHEEQKRIAAILDKADSIRRKRKQALRLTDDFLRSVFLDMFGDLMTNPRGWPIKALSEGVAEFEGGRNVMPTDTPRVDGIRVLKVSAVTSGEYKSHESKSFDDNEEFPDHYIVREGDLLISRANTSELVGAVAYVWGTKGREMLPDKLWRFVWPEDRTIEPLFMLHLARSRYFREQLIQRATGSSGSMKNIGKAKMLEIPIPYPPIELQQRFSQIAMRSRQASEASSASMKQAEQLFAALQQRAFSGQL